MCSALLPRSMAKGACFQLWAPGHHHPFTRVAPRFALSQSHPFWLFNQVATMQCFFRSGAFVKTIIQTPSFFENSKRRHEQEQLSKNHSKNRVRNALWVHLGQKCNAFSMKLQCIFSKCITLSNALLPKFALLIQLSNALLPKFAFLIHTTKASCTCVKLHCAAFVKTALRFHEAASHFWTTPLKFKKISWFSPVIRRNLCLFFQEHHVMWEKIPEFLQRRWEWVGAKKWTEEKHKIIGEDENKRKYRRKDGGGREFKWEISREKGNEKRQECEKKKRTKKGQENNGRREAGKKRLWEEENQRLRKGTRRE